MPQNQYERHSLLKPINFKVLCREMGVNCYQRMEETYYEWVRRLLSDDPQFHERDVKCRENGTPPPNVAQWGPININEIFREIWSRHIAFYILWWEKKILPKKRLTDDKTMFAVVYANPPVGKKIKVTKEHIKNMVQLLDTILVMQPVNGCILIGIFQNGRWVFFVSIYFSELLEMCQMEYSSKKAFPVDISRLEKILEKISPNTEIFPKPDKNVNVGKTMLFDPKGRLIITVSDSLTVTVHMAEFLRHMKNKHVRNLVHHSWPLSQFFAYHMWRRFRP